MSSRITLRGQITSRINSHKEDVFLPREFYDLGGQDQVFRSLRYMVRDGELVKIGYGLYCKARLSSLTGNPMLFCTDGFIGATRQALDKLGVQWLPSRAEIDYNERRSTQIPVNNVLQVKSRFSRKIKYRNAELILEK
jgi:hypothetical protein